MINPDPFDSLPLEISAELLYIVRPLLEPHANPMVNRLQDVFELRDIAKGARCAEVTGRPQSIACGFCRKQIGVLRGVATGKKRGNNPSLRAPFGTFVELRMDHVEACSQEWARSTLCAYALNHSLASDVRMRLNQWVQEHFSRAEDPHWGRASRKLVKCLEALPSRERHHDVEIAVHLACRIIDLGLRISKSLDSSTGG